MEPVVASIIFYAIVIGFCELCRRSLDVVYGQGSMPPRSVKGFLNEAIGTLQAISCVYENQLVAKNYGLLGFALMVFILLNVHRLTNRGCITSPPALLERTFLGHIRLLDAGTILLAELVGAALAFRLATLVWKLGVSPEQAVLGESFQCILAHKVPLIFVAAYEFIAVFLIRTIIGLSSRRKPSWTPYVAAAAISCGITSGFAIVGPVALNPIIAFGRLGGCEGLTLYNHLLTYWVAPASGWIAAWMVERFQAQQGKKIR